MSRTALFYVLGLSSIHVICPNPPWSWRTYLAIICGIPFVPFPDRKYAMPFWHTFSPVCRLPPWMVGRRLLNWLANTRACLGCLCRGEAPLHKQPVLATWFPTWQVRWFPSLSPSLTHTHTHTHTTAMPPAPAAAPHVARQSNRWTFTPSSPTDCLVQATCVKITWNSGSLSLILLPGFKDLCISVLWRYALQAKDLDKKNVDSVSTTLGHHTIILLDTLFQVVAWSATSLMKKSCSLLEQELRAPK